ncbi:Phosphate transport system permease protein PstA [Planctomycetales bacterium 10988]|nr:Phosphate transport system permease protein PstA [Planctomycetales bacterium 10988]
MSTAVKENPLKKNFKPVSREVRGMKNNVFLGVCVVTALISVAILILLLANIAIEGSVYLSFDFLNSPPNPNPDLAGFYPAIWGSVWALVVCACSALPIGIATAIFLEEFKPKNQFLIWMHSVVQLNLTNLAGVPSVVYGLLGMTVFVSMFGLFSERYELGVSYYTQYLSEGSRTLLIPKAEAGADSPELKNGMAAQYRDGTQVQINVIAKDAPKPTDKELLKRTLRADANGGEIARDQWYYLRVPFGRGVLAGGLTLMLVILPIVIISSQEALRAVPGSLREGALGMGCTSWQVVWLVTLPAGIPGILTGAILAMSRAIGEAAPLLIIAGIVYITNAPSNLMSDFTVMPLQIYNWAQRPQIEFHELAATGIIVLLAVLLVFNGIAVFLRQVLSKPLS